MPKVSVIIPTYNCVQYIRGAIDSVLNQTFKDIEIIVVDDGSSDNTRDELTPLIKDNVITYLYQDNKGAASARNHGIREAKGNYIAFLDADDRFLPQMIERCVEELDRGEYDLVSVDNYIAYVSGGKTIKTEIQSYEWIEEDPQELYSTFLKVGGIGGPHKAVFRRYVFDKVGCFDTSLKIYEDLDLWIRIAKYGAKWKHIREPLLICHSGIERSLFTTSSQRTQDYRLKVLQKHRKDAIKQSPEMKEVFAQQLWNFGRSYALEYRAYKKAIYCFMDSMCTHFSIGRMTTSTYNLLKSMMHKGVRSKGLP
jgi:glycosyltransferase involved in cell wall biosynthesis